MNGNDPDVLVCTNRTRLVYSGESIPSLLRFAVDKVEELIKDGMSDIDVNTATLIDIEGDNPSFYFLIINYGSIESCKIVNE